MTSYSTNNLQWIYSTAPKSQDNIFAHVSESSHTIESSSENSSPFFVVQTISTYRRLQPFSISYFTFSSTSSINLGFLILPVVFTSSAAASKLFPAVLSPHHSTTLKKTIADSNPMPTVNANGC